MLYLPRRVQSRLFVHDLAVADRHVHLPGYTQSRLFVYDFAATDRHMHTPGQFHAGERGILRL